MTYNELSNRVQFHLWTILPFGVALLLIAFFLYGCQQKPAEKQAPKETITTENLQTAYLKQLKYEFMYSKFVTSAEKQKNVQMANLYRAIARSEQIHADNHAALLRSRGFEPRQPQYDSIAVGTIVQSLKMSINSEDIETESMFPNLIRTAGLEKDTVAMVQFQHTMDADQRQADLLKEASDHNGAIAKTPYFVCTGCGYIVTSDKTDECPVCHAKKDKFEKI